MSIFDFTRTTKQPSQKALDKHHDYIRSNKAGSKIVFWMTYMIIVPSLYVLFKVKAKGKNNVPKKGAALLAANHHSFFDPFFLAILKRRRLFFVAKAELFSNPMLAFFFVRLGAIPIQRKNGDSTAIETAKILLERGELVGIFPQGTRVKEGEKTPVKKGVVRLASETKAPIIPVGLVGSGKVKKGVFKHKISMVAYPAVDAEDNFEEWNNKVWNRIETACTEAQKM